MVDSTLLLIAFGVPAATFLYMWWNNKNNPEGPPIGYTEIVIWDPRNPRSPGKKLYGSLHLASGYMHSENYRVLEERGVGNASLLRALVDRPINIIECQTCKHFVSVNNVVPLDACKCLATNRVERARTEYWTPYLVKGIGLTDPSIRGLNLLVSTRRLEDPRFYIPLRTRGKWPGLADYGYSIRAMRKAGGDRYVKDPLSGQRLITWLIAPELSNGGGYDEAPGEMPDLSPAKLSEAYEAVPLIRASAKKEIALGQARQEVQIQKTENQRLNAALLKVSAEKGLALREAAAPILNEKERKEVSTLPMSFNKYLFIGFGAFALVTYLLYPSIPQLATYDRNYTTLAFGIVGWMVGWWYGRSHL